MYNTGVIACDGEVPAQLKAVLSIFFPCKFYFENTTNIEQAIKLYCEKNEFKYLEQAPFGVEFLIVFWDKKDQRCKAAINQAYKNGTPTFIYYL